VENVITVLLHYQMNCRKNRIANSILEWKIQLACFLSFKW